MLTIIESIGMHFENELPGYALDLATSIELVHWDTTRYMLYKKIRQRVARKANS